MPRILFVSYTSEWTGPTKSLALLLQHLRERFEVEVLLPGYGPFIERLAELGITYYSMPALTKWQWLSMFALFRRGNFDLVYANSMQRSARLAFAAARIAKIPFINHVREMLGEYSRLRIGYLGWADAVIAVSQACAAPVRNVVRQERLHVVYNGVPFEHGSDGDPVRAGHGFRSELGTSPDALVVLGVSHIMQRKGQVFAVQALAKLVERFPDTHLCLIGHIRDAEYSSRLDTLIGRLKLSDRVHRLGFRDDVPWLIGQGDIFIHTALTEPHPRSVIEAMLASLPVVAFAADGVAETVVDGKTGLLVPPGDIEALAEALGRMVEDPLLRREMGQQGRQRVLSEFTASETGGRVAEIITGVLDTRR